MDCHLRAPPQKFCDSDPIGCEAGLLLTAELLGQKSSIHSEATRMLTDVDISQNTFALLPKDGGYPMVKVLLVGSHQQNSVTKIKCDACGKSYTSPDSFKIHYKISHGPKVCRCVYINAF